MIVFDACTHAHLTAAEILIRDFLYPNLRTPKMEPNEEAVIEAIEEVSKKKKKRTSIELICDVVLKERGISKEETKKVVEGMHRKDILTVIHYDDGQASYKVNKSLEKQHPKVEESIENSFLEFLDNIPTPIKHSTHGANNHSVDFQPLSLSNNDENCTMHS